MTESGNYPSDFAQNVAKKAKDAAQQEGRDWSALSQDERGRYKAQVRDALKQTPEQR